MQINSNSSFYPSLSVQEREKSPLLNDKKDLEKISIEKKIESKENKLTQLDADDKREVAELQSIDSEVRAHEAAHKAAGGALAGSASFTYQKGPDGQMYAVGGEVSINTSSGSTPEETIANAQQIQAAALAPASPSPQDLKVAASAFIMEMKAEQELIKEQREKVDGLKIYKNNSEENQEDTDKVSA